MCILYLPKAYKGLIVVSYTLMECGRHLEECNNTRGGLFLVVVFYSGTVVAVFGCDLCVLQNHPALHVQR